MKVTKRERGLLQNIAIRKGSGHGCCERWEWGGFEDSLDEIPIGAVRRTGSFNARPDWTFGKV